jgi:hypothetical protein
MKKFKLLLLLALALFGLIVQTQAQARLIKGRVTDADGRPLAGATVGIKNTSVVTATDSLGNFQLQAKSQGKTT